jgi:hypothetical protein
MATPGRKARCPINMPNSPTKSPKLSPAHEGREAGAVPCSPPTTVDSVGTP